VDSRLGWTRERRAPIGLRMDGGFGTSEGRNGLRSRGSQVLAKSSNQGRVQQWRQHLGPWPPPSSPGRAMAAVLCPQRFCRTTRQGVMRTPQDKGGYPYAVLVTSLSALEPTTVADR